MVKDPLKVIEQGNCRIEVFCDADCCNPREDFSNIARLALEVRRELSIHEIDDEDYAPFVKNPKNAPMFVFVVYGYSHSGIVLGLNGNAYPFNDPWDAGVAGYLTIDKETLRKEFPNLKNASWKELFKKANEVAEHEIKDLNSWLSGSIYGVCVTNTETERDEWCGGYYEGIEKSDIADLLDAVEIPQEVQDQIEEKVY